MRGAIAKGRQMLDQKQRELASAKQELEFLRPEHEWKERYEPQELKFNFRQQANSAGIFYVTLPASLATNFAI